MERNSNELLSNSRLVDERLRIVLSEFGESETRHQYTHLLVTHDGGTSGDGTYLRSIQIHDSIPTL